MGWEGEAWADWREAGRGAVRQVIEELMQQRVGVHLAARHARGDYDRRNGAYRRRLLTALGSIELCVPRTRTFSAVEVVRAYARRERWVDRVILSAFVLGLSTRKVGEALLPILGERVSPATVSRVAKTLDEAVAAFHRRALEDRYRILLLDGVVLSRRTGSGSLQRPVLVALGIRPDGKKEILEFRLATSESEKAWESFLTDLYRRGLRGRSLELIVADGGTGLLAAAPTVYPHLPVQRCWAHKVRNILDKMRRADREEAKQDLRCLYQARDRVRARRAARRFADRWEEMYPKAVACLRRDLDDLLHFLRYEDEGWRKATRTTNAIERRFREVKRRTRPMGVFSDRTSMERILYAVFSHENQKAGTGSPFLLTHTT